MSEEKELARLLREPYYQRNRSIESITSEAADALDTMEKKLETAMTALRVISEGAHDRPIGTHWREDKKPSKMDRCTHDKQISEDCEACINSYALKALSEISVATKQLRELS